MKNNVKSLSLCLGLASLAFGQTTTTAPVYNMSILAGIQITGNNGLGDNGPSIAGIVASPQGIVVDPSGNIYISDNTNSRIRRIDAITGNITTLAASGVSNPNGIAFDSKGNLIVAQNGNNGQIIRVSTVAITAVAAVPATATTPAVPAVAAVAAGTVTVLAGNNVSGNAGVNDGVYAYDTAMNGTSGVALDKNDNIYIADNGSNRIRLIANKNNCLYTTQTGQHPLTNTCIITTIAGNNNAIAPQVGKTCGGAGVTCMPVGTNTVGDGGPALAARVNGPYGIAVSPDGSAVYFSQNGDHRIRMINMNTGIISTLLGNCTAGGVVVTCPSGSYGSSTGTESYSTNPSGTNPQPGTSSTNAPSNLGDGKLAVNATANSPRGVYLDSVNGILYFADGSNNRVRAINLSTGIVTTVVGGGSVTTDVGVGLNSSFPANASLSTPYGVWVSNGLIYWVEQGSNKARVADPLGQTIRTLVSTPKSTGTNGPAMQANLGFNYTVTTTASPRVAVDPAGNVYVVEASTNQIRQITPDGIIHPWAGAGASGSTGDGGPAPAARLNAPQSVAFDSAGNGYIADTGNNKIRKVDTNGVITTVVGRAQITSCSVAATASGACAIDRSNYAGDGGSPLNAVLNAPQGVAVDSRGNLVIADTAHNAIRYVDMTANTITTIAGGIPAGTPNGPTDGRSGLGTIPGCSTSSTTACGGFLDSTNARYGLFNAPRGVAADSLGNIYVADYFNSAAREVSPVSGGYSLFSIYGWGSGSGSAPSIPTGTGSASVPARIRLDGSSLTSVAVDSGNNIYFANGNDNRVVVISANHDKIYQVAGGGSADTGPTITGTSFSTQTPGVTGVAVDAKGTVYLADRTGLVRKLVCTANCLPLQ